jgi:hypothetical protein
LVDPESGVITGRICHIKAANTNGPRYDPNQSDDERHSFINLLLLCPSHHDIIDKDPENYSAESLHKIKQQHEAAKKEGIQVPNDRILKEYLDKFLNEQWSVIQTTNQSGGQVAHSITNVNVYADKGSTRSIPNLVVRELMYTWSATLLLLTTPTRCFNRSDSGFLTCAGVAAFPYWLYISIFEILLSLLASSFAGHYSIWFFVLQITGGAVRITFLS